MLNTKQYSIPNSLFFKTFSTKSAIMSDMTCPDQKTAIQDKPVLNRQQLPREDHGVSLTDLAGVFKRSSRSAYNKFLHSDRGQELLTKANEFGIPYNKEYIDWFDLMDKICEYESLIEQAEEVNVDWECFNYDPIGLQQEIEYANRAQYEADTIAYYGFFNNVNLGV